MIELISKILDKIFKTIGSLTGVIPESGLHLLFVTLFSKGMIPFWVLLTSSVVQDGHSMLPMPSYSLSNSVKIKVFNFSFGLLFGLILFALGV